jgi:MFS family permease
MKDRLLIVCVCGAEVLTMAGVFAFPALLPTFIAEWGLSKTEAGWIAGLYFAAYAVTAPPVLALTDRIDARWVYLGGVLLAAAASAGFALFAQGFWTALLFRCLAGAALAATYLPGLRVLIDRYQGQRPSRALSFYTSSFSLGTALSFLLVGSLAEVAGWRAAFAGTAAAALLAAAVPLLVSRATPEPPVTSGSLLDFRPVFANRAALAYVLAYGAHCWELFAMRSWLVAFLAFSLTRQVDATAGGDGGWLSPTMVAGLSGLVTMGASILGNELCVRYGRRRVISMVMLASAAAAAVVGFTATLAYTLVVVLILVYSAVVHLDSASLTAGAIESAAPGQRGATLAVHGFFGFACAGLGPLVFGVVLDVAGAGTTTLSWGLGFASLALVGALGPLALRLGRPPADGSSRRPA